MLDQVTLARTLVQHVGHELARRVELVVARENDGLRLLLVVALADEVAVQDVQPAVDRPDVFPQVRGGEPVRVGRVAGTPAVAPVERQKARRQARQPGRHHDFGLADREMHQCPARKAQQRLQHAACTNFRLCCRVIG